MGGAGTGGAVKGGQPASRSCATSSASVGFERSRSDRIGLPVRGRGRQRPRDRGESIVPGEAELVGAVVFVGHEVDELERARGPGTRAPPRPGSATQSSAPSSRVSTTGPFTAGQHRTDVDERDEGPTGSDDPVVELAAMEVQAAQHTGRGGREIGLDERRSWLRRACRRRRRRSDRPSTFATTRGRRRVRRRAARPPRSGRRRSTRMAAPSSRGGLTPPAEQRDVVGERGLPRPHRLTARWDRGLEDAPSGWRRCTLPGRRGHLRDVDLEAELAEELARPGRARRDAGVHEMMDALAAMGWSLPMRSTMASATSPRRSGNRTRRRRRAARLAGVAASSAAARILPGKSLPGGPYSHDVRTIASASGRPRIGRPRRPPHRPAWTRRRDSPGDGGSLGSIPTAVGPAAVEHLVRARRTTRSMPRAAQARARTAGRRRRSAASRAPGRGRSRRRRSRRRRGPRPRAGRGPAGVRSRGARRGRTRPWPGDRARQGR